MRDGVDVAGMGVGCGSSNPLERTTQQKVTRKRQPYSIGQTFRLETEFMLNAYVSKQKRLELSQSLNLTDRQVHNWFINRRRRHTNSQRFSIGQTFVLEMEFILNNYVSKQKLRELTHILKLTDLQVRNWFMNRRKKYRESQRQTQQQNNNNNSSSANNANHHAAIGSHHHPSTEHPRTTFESVVEEDV